MKFAFLQAKEVAFPVGLMYRVLGISRSGHYAWRKRPPSARARQDARLAVEVRAAYERGRRAYGSPRVHRELQGRGVRVGQKRVERLMREGGLPARQKRRFRRTTDVNHAHLVAPEHVGALVQAGGAGPGVGH